MVSDIWHRLYVQPATRDKQTVHVSMQKTKKVLRSTLQLLTPLYHTVNIPLT